MFRYLGIRGKALHVGFRGTMDIFGYVSAGMLQGATTHHCESPPVYTLDENTPRPTKLGAAKMTGMSRGFSALAKISITIPRSQPPRDRSGTYIADELRVIVLDNGAADEVHAPGEIDRGRKYCAPRAAGAAAASVRDGGLDGGRVIMDSVS